QSFVATGTFSDGSTKDLSASVTWTTADGTIASIDAMGNAKGLAQGMTTVTATDGTSTLSASTSLTVSNAQLVSIAITPPSPSIPKGTTQAFVATGTYTDGSMKDLTTAVTWVSSDMTVASVSTVGVATGQGAGTATITGSDPASGVKGSAMLTVTGAVL